MNERVLKFKKENGVVSIGNISKWIDSQLATIANGEWEISFSKIQHRRTNSQNALMWLWFNIIAEAWSDAVGKDFTAENVHDAYCQLYLPITTPKGVNLSGSTKNLTTNEMSAFLKKVQADAQTEYGIRLPDPEDIFFEELAKSYGLKWMFNE